MKITDYIKETQTEMRHVNWPTRKQVVAFTVLVIAFSLGIAFFLGFFDFLFAFLLELFLI
ncbi:MAG: preprotein translocase subunit SecE [Parcubacteria group bacterium]|nr:preprotein translocase subunit SecE [Parcubacteria group bacterium]MBI3075173.1 preprotein translocase subunit SecE [Parcubacteria group bacterium]